jgi:hypothetical protein
MHEGAAFFHMAGVAGLNHAIPFHQFWPGRSMRVVAIGTAHFSFQDRMVGLFVDLGALLFVAGKAHFGLGAFVAYGIV